MTAPPAPTHTVYRGPLPVLTVLRCPQCGKPYARVRCPSETDIEVRCHRCHLTCVWLIRLEA